MEGIDGMDNEVIIQNLMKEISSLIFENAILKNKVAELDSIIMRKK